MNNIVKRKKGVGTDILAWLVWLSILGILVIAIWWFIIDARNTELEKQEITKFL